nr:hypothetical protein [Tanacetum cinerariifolium]
MDSNTHSTYSPWLESFFSTQGIYHHICLSRVVFNLTFVVTEQLDLLPLVHIQLFLVEAVLETLVDTVLRFDVAFCVLRFGYAFCLIEDPIAFCQGEALPNLKSSLHFVSTAGCVLSQDPLRFVSRPVAFCLKTREPDLPVSIPEPFHEQTDEELTEIDIKRMDADDQAIQTSSDIGEQEKKAKLFNEWEKFTSTNGELIESYYHRFMQLMNDLKRNKHFPENIASDFKFLNNLQPEWKRHVTIVRQTKNLHQADFTQIYNFLKMNQDEVNELRAERLAKSHDPLALMAHSHNSFNFPTTHKDQSSSSTYLQQSFPINNKYNPQPSLNQNFMQPPMTSLKDINDPTEVMNAALILFAKAFQLPTNSECWRKWCDSVWTVCWISGTESAGYNAWQNGEIQVAQNAVQNAGVQNGGNQNRLVVVPGISNQNGTGNVVAVRVEGT